MGANIESGFTELQVFKKVGFVWDFCPKQQGLMSSGLPSPLAKQPAPVPGGSAGSGGDGTAELRDEGPQSPRGGSCCLPFAPAIYCYVPKHCQRVVCSFPSPSDTEPPPALSPSAGF